MKRPCILGLCFVVAAACGVVFAASVSNAPGASQESRWPQFRGPDSLGVAPDGMALPTEFGPEKNVLWKTALPRGHSSPCIWGTRLFVTGFDSAAGKLETFCLDRQAGRILWSRTAPATAIEKVFDVNSPAVATPATDGRRVYVYFGSCGLLCYGMDGKEVWRKVLPSPQTSFGTGSSPVLAGELLLLNRDFPPDPSLLAVDAATGRTLWKTARTLGSDGGPVDAYATPVIWHHDGLDEVLVHGKLRLTGYDLRDGKERWSLRITSSACSTPTLGAGQVFVAAHEFGTVKGEMEAPPSAQALIGKYDKNGDGRLSEQEFPADLYLFRRLDATGVPGADVPLKLLFGTIDADKDGQIDREEWDAFLKRYHERAAHAQFGLLALRLDGSGNGGVPHVVWRESRALPEVPSPLCYRGRVYMVRDGGIVSCLEATTGRLLYRKRLPAGGAYFSSPVAGDGKIYFASKNGVVVVVAAGGSMRVLAENVINEPILATPALTDGKVYLRTEKHLYAFGE